MPTSSNTEQISALFYDIAEAIRAKGVSGTMTPYQMPQKILDAFGISETAAMPSNLASVFSEIANSIRTVSGSQETMTPSQMPQKIQDISTDQPETIVKYSDGTTASFNISGVLGTGSTAPRASADITNLENAVEIRIGTNVTSLYRSAFDGCSNLTKVTIPDTVTQFGMYSFRGTNLTSVTVPRSITTIAGNCFRECPSLVEVKLPSTLTAINAYTFYNCTALQSVYIPPGVSSITSGVFQNCSSLQVLDFRDHTSIPTLGSITNISGLPDSYKILVPDNLYDTWLTSGNWANSAVKPHIIKTTKWDSRTTVKYTASSGLLPEMLFVDTLDMSYISSKSANREYIEEINVGSSVKTIYKSASLQCSSLTKITIPDTVISIRKDTFDGCPTNLFDTVTIPGVKLVDGWAVGYTNTLSGTLDLTRARGIAEQAFSNCTIITNVIIPNTIKHISAYAFSTCTNLNTVTIQDGVTSIGDGSFEGAGSGIFLSCNNLTNIIIPSSVKYICSGTFEYTPFYENIPDGLVIFGQVAYAIKGTPPNNITIPSNVVSISAFLGASNSNITILGNIQYVGIRAFSYANSITFTNMTVSQVQNIVYASNFEHSSSNSHTITCSDGSFTITTSCLIKGTDILLADNTTKKIEDLTYDDILKVWDFDEGQLGSAKVCWLTRPGLTSNHYYQLTFDNGTVLKTTGINSNHRIFSVDQSKFTNVCDAKVGDKVFSIDGTLTITDVKYVEEECEYYNVMTSGKINCFANGILTSDRYGNLYPIADMKYVKDGRTIRPYSEYEAVGIDKYWYDNLRLGENTETVEKSKEYVWKCIGQMLPIE